MIMSTVMEISSSYEKKERKKERKKQFNCVSSILRPVFFLIQIHINLFCLPRELTSAVDSQVRFTRFFFVLKFTTVPYV